MKQKRHLTFNEIEEISRRCRRLPEKDDAGDAQLPYHFIDHIEKQSRQLRSDAFAAMFIGLYRAVVSGLNALVSTVKTKLADHGHNTIGASAR